MDLRSPIEALIPGVQGKILATLERVDTELSLRDVARVAGTSPAQTSRVLARLVALGLVQRREVPPTALFQLTRENLVAESLAEVARTNDRLIRKMRMHASAMHPAPESVVLYGSVALAAANAESDIDVLIVRPTAIPEDDEAWQDAVDLFRQSVGTAAGNAVSIMEIDADEAGRRFGRPRGVWSAIATNGITLTGGDPRQVRHGPD